MERWQMYQKYSLPLNAKAVLSLIRIRQFYEHCDGDVYCAFSGGKNSTVLLALLRLLYSDIPAVFVNTGIELPGVVNFVRYMKNHILHWVSTGETVHDIAKKYQVDPWDIITDNTDRLENSNIEQVVKAKILYVPKVDGGNIQIIRPQKTFRDVVERYGYPVGSKKIANTVHKLRHQNLSDSYRNYLLYGDKRGKMGTLPKKWHILLNAPFEVSGVCCKHLKKAPLKKYAKKTGRYPITGETAQESQDRERTYLDNGCNAYGLKEPRSMPLAPWSLQDTLEFIKVYGIRIPEDYGRVVIRDGKYMTTGERATGCALCGFGSHLEKGVNRYQRLKMNYPALFNYGFKAFEQGGIGLGKVLDYIGIPYDIDGQSVEDMPVQASLFDEEFLGIDFLKRSKAA